MSNASGLDDEALSRLRADLATGKRPSLVLLSGGAGMPAGTRGQLVRIDDPPQDAEFLHVKVGGDELPFAPEEVGLPGRRTKTAASAASPAPAPVVKPSAKAPEPILEPVRPDRRTRADRVVTPPPSPAEPTTTAPDPDLAERPVAERSADKPRAKRPARSGGGAPPKLTLTLRFADFAWTVETAVAGRRDKPQPVPLAAIRGFADQLEDQTLRRSLEATVEACRSEAQKKAATLRAELARLETELAALDE
ncbi:MAG: hypothetical protein QOJ32_1197 [Frankiaceae bacterium]|jgi:hypothetical protein|nr:hypothetical protein [Frankiaceae bacterium]